MLSSFYNSAGTITLPNSYKSLLSVSVLTWSGTSNRVLIPVSRRFVEGLELSILQNENGGEGHDMRVISLSLWKLCHPDKKQESKWHLGPDVTNPTTQLTCSLDSFKKHLSAG